MGQMVRFHQTESQRPLQYQLSASWYLDVHPTWPVDPDTHNILGNGSTYVCAHVYTYAYTYTYIYIYIYI